MPCRRPSLPALCFACLALVGTLTGCPPSSDGDSLSMEVPPVLSAPRNIGGITLTCYGEMDGLGAKLDVQLARAFADATSAQVVVIPRNDSANNTYDHYQALFKQSMAELDVLMIDVIWPGALAPHLRDLTPDLGADAAASFPELVRNNTIDGKLVAMPWYVDAGMLYYRKDLLAKYGFKDPPATWEQLEQEAATIQKGEAKTHPGFAGFVWQGRADESLVCNALEWQVSQGGGAIFDEETGAANVANPQAVAAFKRAAGWVGGISPSEVTSFGEEEARQAFERGNAAFMRNWPYAYASAQLEGSAVRDRVGVAPLPHAADPNTRSAATLGGWQLGVSAASRHPEAAIAYVRYVTSPAVQRWRALKGAYLPSQPAAYADPDLIKAWPFFKVMPAILEGAVTRPSSRAKERYGRVSDLYAEGVGAILAGADPAAETARMQKAIAAVMR